MGQLGSWMVEWAGAPAVPACWQGGLRAVSPSMSNTLSNAPAVAACVCVCVCVVCVCSSRVGVGQTQTRRPGTLWPPSCSGGRRRRRCGGMAPSGRRSRTPQVPACLPACLLLRVMVGRECGLSAACSDLPAALGPGCNI